MAHCGGGEGPNTFDMMSAITDWRENGHAPERIIAFPYWPNAALCAYPQVATYKGSGSIDDAREFCLRDAEVGATSPSSASVGRRGS